METFLPRLDRPSPRVFNYSLDWRFLLPLTETGRSFVLFEQEADFSETLARAGMPASVQLSFPEIDRQEGQSAHSLVLPFGLPLRWVGAGQADQIGFYRSIRRLIEPGGYLLVGFETSWNFRSRRASKYHPSTPRRMTSLLEQAGFKSVKIFGAIPNLRIPEYIFELGSPAMQFALCRRFRRKPVLLSALQMLARTVGLARLSSFLPCCFAVAVV
ncbi:MAG: hypothetical protein WCC12_00450 [Anaerolineales bacterium]